MCGLIIIEPVVFNFKICTSQSRVVLMDSSNNYSNETGNFVLEIYSFGSEFCIIQGLSWLAKQLLVFKA